MIPADLGGRIGQHRLLGQSCSHGEHIKCSPARAELAIDVALYARPGPWVTLLDERRFARSLFDLESRVG